MIRHEHSDLSAVLLYLNNQHLVAAAYSIDCDQLPQSTQVSLDCPARLTLTLSVFYRLNDIYVIVRPLSTVGYTSVVMLSTVDRLQWSN